MTTLAKRATPAQQRILRIVQGAVLNVADAHGLPRDPYLARSIAKRATGTLTAGWPEVLAARLATSSDKARAHVSCPACERRLRWAKRLVRLQRISGYDGPLSNGERQSLARRSPLYPFWREIALGMRALKRSGDTVRFEIHRDLLRRIDKAMRKEFEMRA
jgi:hypothetical protein